ncbi:hypothetical protein G9A89_016598 [Geosiphon pyriformis]|nr:hypothetical protein G9A89_016598 [Geosiphon pyriformis]
MLLDDPSSKALKEYLTQQLEPICDADPGVLADYVIALLKHDKSSQDLRQLCVSQLDDFLKEETEPFVGKLFNALNTKEYLGKISVTPPNDQSENIPEPTSKVQASNSTQAETKPTKSSINQPDKNEYLSLPKSGIRKRAESEGSDEDDDRNFKHREREGDNREDYRRQAERQSNFSNRDDDRETKNKRMRSDGIPTGPAAGPQYNNAFQDDRSSKRRRDESDEEFRSNKIPRNNMLGPNQNIGVAGNGYALNGIGYNVGARRVDYDRNSRLHSRNFAPVTPNSSAPNIGSGRWGNEWGSNGMNLPVGDRFEDRKVRGGRVNDRGGGRNGPLVLGRGGFPDIRPGRQSRCRDYDEKGYCMRGDLCPFDHGVDRIVVDDVPLNRPFDIIPPIGGAPMAGNVGMMGPGVPGRPPFFMGTTGTHNQFDIEPPFPTQQTSRSITPTADAYDPERAALSRPEELNQSAITENKDNETSQIPENRPNSVIIPALNPNAPPFIDSNGQPSNRGSNSSRGRTRGRGARGNFSRSSVIGQISKNSTLVVENIPAEFCTIDKVNEFFKKFGIITNINVDPPFQKAIIQFSTSQEASKAYNSPEPIFDNRFVKVYWHKVEKEEQQQNSSTSPSKQPVIPSIKLDSVSTIHSVEIQASIAEKQKEAEEKKQKEIDEKVKKQKENLKAILEIQKQREQLIQRQIEEQKKFMELAKKKTGDPKGREELLSSLSRISEDIKKDTSISVLKPMLGGAAPILTGGAFSKNLLEEKERERLDRELDALSKLNESGGVPPETALGQLTIGENSQVKPDAGKPEGDLTSTTNSLNDASSSKVRGRGIFGFRGRARTIWPRVRGGGVLRSYKLDNRPTKLILKEVPRGSQDTLRSYFEQFGEVESLTINEEIKSAIVQFKNRHEAEQALSKGRNIPEIGAVSINWHTEPTSGPVVPSEPKNTTIENDASESLDATTTAQTTTEPIKSEVTFDEDEEDEERERSWKR